MNLKKSSITCAAITLCLSTTNLQLAQVHSLQWQTLLWPFKHEITPWFLQRAHFGVLRNLLGRPSADMTANTICYNSKHDFKSTHHNSNLKPTQQSHISKHREFSSITFSSRVTKNESHVHKKLFRCCFVEKVLSLQMGFRNCLTWRRFRASLTWAWPKSSGRFEHSDWSVLKWVIFLENFCFENC